MRSSRPSGRSTTLPAPITASAKALQAAFTCTLCAKSYSRVSDYDAHLASYDHLHRQRLKDLKSLSKDPSAADKARERERKEDEKLGGGTFKKMNVLDDDSEKKTGKGFKKGGFKRAFGGDEGDADENRRVKIPGVEVTSEDEEVDCDDYYDPAFPTD